MKSFFIIIPGSGAAEFSFSDCISKGVKFYRLRRSLLVARLNKYGESIYISGKREKLFLGSINTIEDDVRWFKNFISEMFEIATEVFPNYLCVTLTPSNPILHTTRIYSIFKNYGNDISYPRNILFYEEWNSLASELLINCDNELQNICKSITSLDLTSVISLRKHYESENEYQLATKIRGVKVFKGLLSPMIKKEGYRT